MTGAPFRFLTAALAAGLIASSPVADPSPAHAQSAPGGFGATVVSQGLARSGADVLMRDGLAGQGLVIAVLDLGFGDGLGPLQAAGELPPPGRLQTRSFDTFSGLPGRNVYGNRTNHGEIVAQTVFDYAPRARYLFVNYHSEQEFVAAVDWLVQRRPDIVVHSNNFLEGPFDGTGDLARAVDRAADAGILWFNSAGNYARRHWSGSWADADRDGVLDWADPAWTFQRDAGQPLTFALSWKHADSARPTDLDLVVEHRREDGSWQRAVASEDRQGAGAPAAERITGWRATPGGTYRLRIVHLAGPPPSAPLTLFSREITLAGPGPSGGPPGSVPTPADARGAIAVGAVEWRGDRLMSYSSQGPTPDGRLKPDLVAPTNTAILGPQGVRGVGGTSNAAPNAAGAAALLIGAERRAGRPTGAPRIRALLERTAVDLGAPGPDPAFGAGRVKVLLRGPAPLLPTPAPGSHVRRVIFAGVGARSPTALAGWSLALGDRTLVERRAPRPGLSRIDTRRLPDGVHILTARVSDFPGNVSTRRWAVRVDNTAPELRSVRMALGPRRRPAARRPVLAGPERPARAIVVALDRGGAGPLTLSARVVGRPPAARPVRVRPGARTVLELGALRRGRYAVQVAVSDRAGNAVRERYPLIVR